MRNAELIKKRNEVDTNIVIVSGVKMTVAEYRLRNGGIRNRKIIHVKRDNVGKEKYGR